MESLSHSWEIQKIEKQWKISWKLARYKATRIVFWIWQNLVPQHCGGTTQILRKYVLSKDTLFMLKS